MINLLGMSLTNAMENAFLLLFFNGTAWADIAQNDASGPLTQFQISAHTADPGEAGSQNTNETAYTSYARIVNDRNGTDWPVTGNAANLGAIESFPACTGSTSTLTHMGIGKDGAGAGTLYMSGTITPNLSVATGVTPQLTTSTAVTVD